MQPVPRSVRQILLTLLLLAALQACSTVHHLEQEHQQASLHRQQVAEAEAANAEPKSERDRKAREAQQDARLRQARDDLTTRGDADSLAAASILTRFVAVTKGTSDSIDLATRAIDLATRAVSAAPGRADLLFLLMQLCESASDCAPIPLEERLLQLDPGNGIPWTYGMARADAAGVLTDRATARTQLAQALRIDPYWNSIVSHTVAAAIKVGLPVEETLIQVIGVLSALPIPLQGVSKACAASEVEQAQVLEQCRHIAALYRQAPTTLFAMYGTSLGVRLWPADSIEVRDISAQRRVLHYRQDLMQRHSVKVNAPQAVRALVNYMGRYPSEQQAFRALYVELGLNPDPPPEWVDRAS